MGSQLDVVFLDECFRAKRKSTDWGLEIQTIFYSGH
jgi:hypothetical protein